MPRTNQECTAAIDGGPQGDYSQPLHSVEPLAPVLQSEAAGQTGLAQHIGDRVLISCHAKPNGASARESAERIGTLSESEYRVFSRMAQGWGYRTIAAELDLSVSTVRTHLGNTYEKISADRGGEEAASFMPLEERSLSAAALYSVGSNGEVEHKLSKSQREVCDLLIAGHTRQEIALRRKTSDSTTRTHVHGIYAALGMDTRFVERPGIVLRRLAAGTANLNAYYEMLGKLARGLQPKVVGMLQDEEVSQLEHRVGKIMDDEAARPKLLEPLETSGYVTPDTASGNRLDLVGVVAAGLVLHKGYQEIMLHDQTAPIAREVVRQEVDYYLEHGGKGLSSSAA